MSSTEINYENCINRRRNGGHIFPILAVARKIKKQLGEREDLEFLFLGPEGELEKEVMEKELIPPKKFCAENFGGIFL